MTRLTRGALGVPLAEAGVRSSAGLMAALILLLPLVSCQSDGQTARAGSGTSPAPVSASGPPAPARAGSVSSWREGVRADYQPLATSALTALQSLNAWRQGQSTATSVAPAFRLALAGSRTTRAALARRTTVGGTERSALLFQETADLYTSSLGTALTATTLPGGMLQGQLQRTTARLRDLADRVFEQGNDLIRTLLPPGADTSGVEVRRVADVTDYDSVELGVGPPLEARPAAPRPLRTFQDDRPQQSLASWRAAVTSLHITPPAQVDRITGSATGPQLAAAARGLVAAADALYALPDPRGGRYASTHAQLGLQVAAEALRSAQAATLVKGADAVELRAVSRQLAVFSARLRGALV